MLKAQKRRLRGVRFVADKNHCIMPEWRYSYSYQISTAGANKICLIPLEECFTWGFVGDFGVISCFRWGW